MGKKSDGQRRAAKLANRRRRQERAAAAREDHVRTVVERSGDPRFVQQRFTEDGRQVMWSRETPAGAHIEAALESQLEAFREKFGREPSPDDPLFFDPEASEPTSLKPGAWNSALESAAQQMAPDDPLRAMTLAAAELGFMVTEENRHLYSALDVERWNDAVERHLDPLGLGIDDDLDDDGEAARELFDLVRDSARSVVGSTLAEQSPEPAKCFVERLIDADEHVAEEDLDDGAPGVTFAFAALMEWLVMVRDHVDRPSFADDVTGWVEAHLDQAGPGLTMAAGLLGGAAAEDATVDDLVDALGDDLVPALVWLVSGAVAVAGDGDVAWLRAVETAVEDD